MVGEEVSVIFLGTSLYIAMWTSIMLLLEEMVNCLQCNTAHSSKLLSSQSRMQLKQLRIEA